jgi:hypothetical protein
MSSPRRHSYSSNWKCSQSHTRSSDENGCDDDDDDDDDDDGVDDDSVEDDNEDDDDDNDEEDDDDGALASPDMAILDGVRADALRSGTCIVAPNVVAVDDIVVVVFVVGFVASC